MTPKFPKKHLPIFFILTLLLASFALASGYDDHEDHDDDHPPVGCYPNTKGCSNPKHDHRNCSQLKPISPKFESCVDNLDGSYTATWGYTNNNNQSINISIGENNRLKGPGTTANMGQPTQFSPGTKTNVFSTKFRGKNMSWVLNGKKAGVRKEQCLPKCALQDTLINDPWNTFNTAKWVGDGDQFVTGGFFTVRPGASSAFADFNSTPVSIEVGSVLHFEQTIKLIYPDTTNFAQSGILFLVNKDTNFTNYTYVNIGYSNTNKVFVELFGADGINEFDQFVETSIPSLPVKSIKVDLQITRNSYAVYIDGIKVNSVALTVPLPSLNLLQVGVQKNPGGLEGQLDNVIIFKTCQPKDPCQL